jgi:hypothetical protein
MRIRVAACLAISLAACADAPDIEDPIDDVFMTDDAKADAFGVEDWSPDGAAVLKLVSTATKSKLQNDVGLSANVANGIVTKRSSLGGTYRDLAELDAAPYVGKTVFQQLLRYAGSHHLFKTALRVPLIVDDGADHKVSITSYNDEAHSVGMQGFARYTFVDEDTHYADKMNTYNMRLQEVAMKAQITIDGEMMVYAYNLGEYAVGSQHVCFIGDPLEVADVAGGHADDLVGDMYSVWGWRYKTHKWQYDDGDDQLGDDWSSYSTSSKFVRLIVTNSDSGDDPAADDVPPCR